MWKDVFPEYAVKQSLHEVDLQRSDEYILTAMQSDLLTRCLFNVLKSALLHCISKKRKYINERDIEVGQCLCIFPFKPAPPGAGNLLDPNEFYSIVLEHIELCVNHISKNIDIVCEKGYKISQDSIMKLQMQVEGCIRGFVQKLSNSSQGSVSFRQFEMVMGSVLGDTSYTLCDNGYIPVC
jgi:hypothetical protein